MYLLLFESNLIFKELGIWYCVVVGISEVMDVFIIVILEEIGEVLIIKDNELMWGMMCENYLWYFC